MATTTIENISDHQEAAYERLPAQYQEAPGVYPNAWGVDDISGWQGTIYSLVGPSQTLEDILESMLTERGLNTAAGVNLDRLGQLVGIEREGRGDERYREVIVGKIAENNSDGTARDLLSIANVLLSPFGSILQIYEFFPAKARIDYSLAEGETGVNPVTIQESLSNAKAAGVGLSTLRYVEADYFGFDSDPDAAGYGSLGPVETETFASGNDYFEIATLNKFFCQSFIPVGSELVSVSMNSFFNRFGTATGDIKLSLYSVDGSDLPDTLIADSTNVIDMATLDTGFSAQDSTPVTFNFASIAMTPGTTYSLVVSTIGYGGANFAVNLKGSNPYTDGFAGSSNDAGVTWNANITGRTDLDFQMTIVESSSLELFFGAYYPSLVK